jgi:glutaminyl-peptide cyclotransferase
MRKLTLFLIPFLALLAGSGYKIVHTYPHDRDAFTQGLLYHEGFLYEATGIEGKSSLRKVELTTGKVLQRVDLPGAYFGEGLALWKDKLIQLTWKSKIGFVYDRATFRQIRTFNYSREGWGITQDGKRLIMSDGSSTLYFWDPETFKEVGHLDVTDKGKPVPELNELEYVRGEIYANVWMTERIARISPATGRVLGWIDLPGLLTPAERASTDVLNGIAYDAKQNRLFVTGKRWPKLFEIAMPGTGPTKQPQASARGRALPRI